MDKEAFCFGFFGSRKFSKKKKMMHHQREHSHQNYDLHMEMASPLYLDQGAATATTAATSGGGAGGGISLVQRSTLTKRCRICGALFQFHAGQVDGTPLAPSPLSADAGGTDGSLMPADMRENIARCMQALASSSSSSSSFSSRPSAALTPNNGSSLYSKPFSSASSPSLSPLPLSFSPAPQQRDPLVEQWEAWHARNTRNMFGTLAEAPINPYCRHNWTTTTKTTETTPTTAPTTMSTTTLFVNPQGSVQCRMCNYIFS
jgi:hypothetical protein